MPTINELLKWHFRPSHLKYPAEHLFTQTTKNQVGESKQMLEKIIDRLPDGGEAPNRQSIEDVYYLFLNNMQTPLFSFSKRNTRILIWVLDYQPPFNTEKILLSDKFVAALNLFYQNWRDSFIVNLWHVLLKNWTDLQLHDNNRKLLIDLLKGKSKVYIGRRTSILKITQDIDFFLTTDSPQKYAALLIDKKIIFCDANKLFNHKERVLRYDYFSAVAHEYIYIIWSKNKNMIDSYVKGVYQFLKDHKSAKTSLMICAQIINDKVFNNNIEIIKSETVKLIGDPAEHGRWRHSDLKENEKQEVEQARIKLNILLNKQFIETFFKVLVEDERREKYWLKFIDKIEDIKFVGNRANYLDLKKIESISNLVNNRYKITSSSQSTCALIMYSRGFVFVEFSDIGALYIYKQENFNVNLNAVNSMRDLKTLSKYDYPSINSVSLGKYMENEKRITHQGDWESRVDRWMRYYYD